MIRGFHVTKKWEVKKWRQSKVTYNYLHANYVRAKHPILKAKRKYEDKTQQEPIRQDVTSIAFLVVHFQWKGQRIKDFFARIQSKPPKVKDEEPCWDINKTAYLFLNCLRNVNLRKLYSLFNFLQPFSVSLMCW